MTATIPTLVVGDFSENHSFISNSDNFNDGTSNEKINGIPLKIGSIKSTETTTITGTSSDAVNASIEMEQKPLTAPKNLSVDLTNSIGSAGSIMFRASTSSGVSRKTSSSIGQASLDLDEEILVGDEKDFHDACRRGDLEVVERLVKSGIDINCRNKHDRTPLHWIAGNGHIEILKTLLDEGALIDASDKFGMDALLWAAWFGQTSIVQHLLEVGAKPTSRNKHGYTWLHCATHNDHVSVVDILKEDMQDFDRDITEDNERSSLHIACKFGKTEVARRLVQLGCNVKLKDKFGNTPLHVAAKYGFHEMVPLLIEANCDLDEVNADYKTVLHVAAEAGSDKFCEALLQTNLDVNCETEDETCPLHLAAAGGHTSTVNVLISHDADLDAGNKHNQTPLHFAVMSGDFSMTRLLVKAGANTSIPDARSETVLHLACENGLSDILETILLSDSDLTKKDLKGYTPIDVAARGNYVVLVDMLIKAERFRLSLIGSQSSKTSALLKPLSYKADSKAKTQQFRVLLYQLASKYFKRREWKQLAFYWSFTDKQLQMIEEQYTGSKSYREHGHRMLLIWLHGCTYSNLNPVRELFDGLVNIQRRDLAEMIRMKANQNAGEKSCLIS